MLALLVSLVLGQTTEQVPTLISGGGTAAALAFAFWLSRSDREEKRRLQEELRETNDKTLAMAEKAIPALVEATRALTDVKAAMDSPNRSAVGGVDLDRMLREMGRLTEELRSRER